MNAACKSSRHLPRYLNLCVVDTAPAPAATGWQVRSGVKPRRRPVARAIAGIRRPGSGTARVGVARGRAGRARTQFPVAVAGRLLATAMLGALLLTVTGRTRRIETAVAERTAALQRESPSVSAPTPTCARASSASHILNNVRLASCTPTCMQRAASQPALCELTGYNVDQLMSMNVTALTHPEDHFQTSSCRDSWCAAKYRLPPPGPLSDARQPHRVDPVHRALLRDRKAGRTAWWAWSKTSPTPASGRSRARPRNCRSRNLARAIPVAHEP